MFSIGGAFTTNLCRTHGLLGGCLVLRENERNVGPDPPARATYTRSRACNTSMLPYKYIAVLPDGAGTDGDSTVDSSIPTPIKAWRSHRAARNPGAMFISP